MFSFEPTDEQKMLIETINRFAQNDLRQAAHDADETGQLPPRLIQKGWELGVLQASVPEAYGGFGDHSALTGALAAEEMAYGDLAGAMTVMLPGLFALPILLAGSEEQKQAYLPDIMEGNWAAYSAAWIEPGFAFDPNDLNVRAQRDNGAYLLTGQKAYVPYAPQAKALIVYARLEDQTQAFIVPAGTDGVTIKDRQKLLGIHAYPLYTVSLDNVRLSKENRLGGEGGHEIAPLLNSTWVALAAMAVGEARAAFEYSRDYAKEREVFGVKVAQKQAIAFMLAEMATEIEAIRLLTWEAAWMIDQGKEGASKEAYLALTGAIDMAMMVTDRAVQILGGHGYIREHPVERWMRNGRGFATFTGLAMV